ncbi:mitotic spindle assembly checkpoint protein MAD1-like isoform X2 [Pomacea canaliculata]|uniref:mitotic spindle assembly checkpoint protein MAD1-like isoform X2 n=1 Tax=Pomacea canaliculata TaxID=400727 RepID=UPI000D7300ED|nr:mitotic spindle assembly checkpoint protein MAD1-like isoform X2 [Pomacea canaliculata]
MLLPFVSSFRVKFTRTSQVIFEKVLNMEPSLDTTASIRMQKDFDAFLSGIENKGEHPSFLLDLDGNLTKGLPNPKQQKDASSLNIKHLTEKEKEGKRKETELLAARSQIALLQSQLSSLQSSHKRARIEFETDLEAVKNKRYHETERMSELRLKLQQTIETKEAMRNELAEERREWESVRSGLEAKLRQVQREKMVLEEEIQKVHEESWKQMMELKHESGRCLVELQLNVTELEEAKAQLNLQNQQIKEMRTQLKDLEEVQQKLHKSDERIKELEEVVAQHKEDAAIAHAMRADVEKVPGLEKELVKLRTENEYYRHHQHNILLLQEQHASMKLKFEQAEKRLEDLTRLQFENEELNGRLQRWEAEDSSGSRRPQSPSQLSRRVMELQIAQALALEQNGELQSRLSIAEAELEEAKELKQKMSEDLTSLKLQREQHEDKTKRLHRKLLLVTKERECYKRILDSYESEITVQLPANARVQQLEEVVEEYRTQLQELETQLQQLTDNNSTLTARCRELERHQQKEKVTVQPISLKADQEKIQQLVERIVELEYKLKVSENDKMVLEMRIEQRHLQGDFDPSCTKILHYSLNPAALAQKQRQQELERLQEENAQLTARVQVLESKRGAVEDVTEQVDQMLHSASDSKVIEELRAQLALEELRKKRLVEAFKKTSHEFRETCYQLLGYKIDMPATGQYRLASMYAESPHDYLLFKQGPSGEIQMLQTEFSERQQDKMDLYLQHKDSIPALLSAITLDLFNQQTMNLG